MFWHYQNAGESTIRMLLLFYLKLCKNWWCSCKSFWWHCLYWEKSVLSVLLTHLQKNKDLFLFPGDMYISAHSPSFSKALKEKKSILSLSESQCLLLMRNCRNSQGFKQKCPCCSVVGEHPATSLLQQHAQEWQYCVSFSFPNSKIPALDTFKMTDIPSSLYRLS